jgi:recombination associated protein RdgC
MFFRNLTLFRFPTTHNLNRLGDGMGECRLKPVGPLEMSSRGFISPFGRDHDALGSQIGDAIWIAVGGEERMLPGAVVNDLLAKKLADIEKAEGRKPGGRTRKRIKDELLVDLLPRAFVKPRRTDAIIDWGLGIVAVDTSSRKVGETVISEIRRAIGSFPALPLNAEIAPRSILTGWVAGEQMPEGLSIGDECVLQDPIDGGATIKCSRQELESDEIAKHLETGKQVTRLALTYADRVSFVIGEDLVVRKFKLLDGALDKMDDGETRENLRAELDARFALMSGEIRELFGVLERALKLSKVEA